MPDTPAKRRWDAANTRTYGVKLNVRTDADLIAALDAAENRQGFIKKALRAYAEGNREKEENK